MMMLRITAILVGLLFLFIASQSMNHPKPASFLAAFGLMYILIGIGEQDPSLIKTMIPKLNNPFKYNETVLRAYSKQRMHCFALGWKVRSLDSEGRFSKADKAAVEYNRIATDYNKTKPNRLKPITLLQPYI